MSYKKIYTLVFPRKDAQILLGLKKRGFGSGRWNGFGGKVEPEETIIQAAIRETKEECGLLIQEKNLKYLGHLEFYFQGEPLIMIVKVFSTFIFEGEAAETEEMKPKWFNISTIPYKDMWPDDKYWFPHMLKGITFTGTFWFQGHNDIIRQQLRQITKDELNSL